MDANRSCELRSGRTVYSSTNFNDIVVMLSSGLITFNAEARDPGAKEWTNLLSYADFAAFVSRKMRQATSQKTHDSLFSHWYLKDGQSHFGPFSVLQILEFFCQGRIDLEQMVRHPSSNSWEPLSSTSLFEVRSLGELLSCDAIRNLVSRRKHPRIDYDNEAFVSVKGELYQGVSFSLSAGGLGVLFSEETDIEVGDPVNVIINGNGDHSAVQMKAKVVSLRRDMNTDRIALEFADQNHFLNHYIRQRIPG